MNFFLLDGQMMSTDQARKWRAEQTRLAEIFCGWCTSKAVRHTKECKTREEGFSSETTPKLTREERAFLIKQKDETINKGQNINTELVA